MNNESLWLGPLRAPVRLAATVTVGVTLILSLYLILGRIFGFSDVGMHEMLRPEGRVTVIALLLSVAAAFLLVSIYLSDTRGTIEVEATGPIDIISLVFSRLATIAIAGTVFVMFYEVVSRYVFVKPTLWANELSLWIAGFVFLLAGLYAMQQRSHIRIYIIYDMFPRWLQKAADVFSVMLIWFFTISMVWGGFNEARDKILRWETFGTAWDPPIPATIKAGILTIISLVAVQALSNLIADWHKEPESHTPMDDVDQAEIENIRRAIED